MNGVLLAEVGAVRRDNVKELGYDGGYAGEVAGARGSIEAVADVGYGDGGERTGRVHLGYGGGEEDVYSGGFQLLGVFGEGARVFVQVFGGGEL